MPSYPYYMVLNFVLTANGTGTVTFTAANGEEYDLMGIRQQSTGAFVVTDIRSSNGNHFTNASPAFPIPNDVFQDTTSPNIQYTDFPEPLHIEGGSTFYIDLKDTTAAPNTVNLIISAKRTTQGG